MIRCQCVLGNNCEQEADPASGEAMLCHGCLNNERHFAANAQPRRLPRRRTILTTVAVMDDLL